MGEPLADTQEPVNQNDTRDNAGQLWNQICERSRYALSCGALEPIPTNCEFVEQEGIRFLVRILANLNRKEQANKKQQALQKQGKDFNPFLPYEEDLFVAHLSPTHLCLLNKFNVVDHHILMVTRQFEHQDTWLNHSDFAALWTCLRNVNGLGFYNGGKVAGASQKHKHLQLVPLPLGPEEHTSSMEAVLSQFARTAAQSTLPFHHGFTSFSLPLDMSPQLAAPILWEQYWKLLNEVGICRQQELDRHTHPYNLLITRKWMLLVPRRQEKTQTISINSLGFVGSLFVKNQAQLDMLKQHGPMTLLQHVTYPGTVPLPLSPPLLKEP